MIRKLHTVTHTIERHGSQKHFRRVDDEHPNANIYIYIKAYTGCPWIRRKTEHEMRDRYTTGGQYSKPITTSIQESAAQTRDVDDDTFDGITSIHIFDDHPLCSHRVDV